MSEQPTPSPVPVGPQSPSPPAAPDAGATAWHRGLHAGHLVAVLALGCAVGYGLLSYEFVPSAWRFVERRHPALASMGTRAFTSNGIPGDPLNLAFVGAADELQLLMRDSGWTAADPITWRSSTRIAYDSVARRPYEEAPVSNLFVNGKRQDMAFEKAAGHDPSKRHHVRFWQAEQRDALGRMLWMGAATFDSSVGLSHTTGQITHHIAADIDSERDALLLDLQQHGGVAIQWLDAFQPQHDGRNGGGDRFYTDARLAIVSRPPQP